MIILIEIVEIGRQIETGIRGIDYGVRIRD